MREYSHAFTHNGDGAYYSKYMEIFNSGVVYYGMQECEFVQTIREKYGLNVVFTDFSLYNQTAAIYVYVDFEDNTCPVADELKGILRKNDAHLPLDNLISTASEHLKVFATNIVDTFLDTFGYKKSDLDKVFLYVDDFVCSFLATIHGVALPDMQAYMKRTFGVDGIWRVIVGYEPSITIVTDDPKVYKKLRQKQEQIEKKAYAMMKQHDHFDLLTQQDVHILILLKSELDRNTINRYARELSGSLNGEERSCTFK